MKRLWWIIGAMLCMNITLVSAQSTVLFSPVVYIGPGGNVYLTDGTESIQFTDDAASNDTGNDTYYDNPTWSPDGSAFAYIRTGDGGRSLIVAESDSPPRVLLDFTGRETLWLQDTHFAWSPDSQQIAFYGGEPQEGGNRGVFTVNVADGTTQFVIEAYSGVIGEPNELDPAVNITSLARGFSPYGAQLVLAWSDAGIVVTSAAAQPLREDGGLVLVTPDGDRLWNTPLLNGVIYSLDGTHLVGWNWLDDTWQAILDMASGEMITLDLPEGAFPVGWVGDTLLYRTRSDIISISGVQYSQAGFEVFDWVWGFETESAKLHLWSYNPLSGDTVPVSNTANNFGGGIIELQGYDIATVRGWDENTALMHYVTSNVAAVLAINEGAAAVDVQHLKARTHITKLALDPSREGGTLTIARFPGRQGSYTRGQFAVYQE